MRTPVQPGRQEGRAARRRLQRRSSRTPGRVRAAYAVVVVAVLAAGAPGLAGARAAGAQGAAALRLHGVLLALCALLGAGVVAYAFRGCHGLHGAAGSGVGSGADGSGETAARTELAAVHAVRAELADARDAHVVERDSLLRERAALTERIAGLQDSVQRTFVGLSRRTLGLVERQLSFIDELEAHEQEPATLDTLFRLDHLAACMRRHSENLLVLAGADQRGARRENLPLIDVLRAAVGEIEAYQRVLPAPDVPQTHITGFACGDTSHLLAELLENATACSPPESEVRLTGRVLGTGELLLTVRDEGIGIAPAERLDELNARLAEADPGPAPGDALGLGLYVVARLAARHGIRVELRARQRGIDAEVTLPARLLAPGPAETAPPADERSAGPPQPSGATGGLRPTPDPAPASEPDSGPPAGGAAGEPEQGPAEPGPAGADVPQPRRADGGWVRAGTLPRRTPTTQRKASAQPPAQPPAQTPAREQYPQPERQSADAGEVRRLLGGLQQGSRDGRRAAAAEADTKDPKDQGAHP